MLHGAGLALDYDGETTEGTGFLHGLSMLYGDGNQTRDFVFVDDVAHANVLAMQGPLGTFNIGTGVQASLNQLLVAFERVIGHPAARQYALARKGEGRESGWMRQLGVQAGLPRLVIAGRWLNRWQPKERRYLPEWPSLVASGNAKCLVSIRVHRYLVRSYEGVR